VSDGAAVVTFVTRPLESVVMTGIAVAEPYVDGVPTAPNVGFGYVPVRSPPAVPVGGSDVGRFDQTGPEALDVKYWPFVVMAGISVTYEVPL
jgi:hypothetical protein